MKFIKKYRYELLLLSFLLLYVAYFTYASFLRYDNFFAGKFDLGNMTQTVWNTAHGRIFQLTDPNGTREISRLAVHADFILAFLAPLYFLWSDPRMLLLTQTVVLAFGGIFVYLLTQHVLKNKPLSLTLAIAYFINPAVNFTNLYDFHAVTLATTFLLAAFYFITRKKYGFMFLFLFLAGISKEEVWLINAFVGIYLVFSHREKAVGALIFSSSAFMFYVLIWHLIPKSLGQGHFALSYYSDFGDTPAKIIGGIIISPLKTLRTLFMPDRLLYVRELFMPFGYLSIFSPLFMVFAAPDLGIDLLSNNPPLHQLYYQYSATVTPFIIISTIFGIKFIRSKIPEIPNLAFVLIIGLLSFSAAYTYGPLPYSLHPSLKTYSKTVPNKSLIYEYLSTVKPEEKIAATNNIGAQLSNRQYIYVLPSGIDEADKVIFLISRSINSRERETLENIKNDPNYVLDFSTEGFYAFKRTSP